MHPTLALVFFFATAPVALMPGIIALLTRHRARLWLVPMNLALWGGIFLLVRSFSLDTSALFRLPTYLALLGWLTLLAWAIRGADAGRRGPGT